MAGCYHSPTNGLERPPVIATVQSASRRRLSFFPDWFPWSRVLIKSSPKSRRWAKSDTTKSEKGRRLRRCRNFAECSRWLTVASNWWRRFQIGCKADWDPRHQCHRTRRSKRNGNNLELCIVQLLRITHGVFLDNVNQTQWVSWKHCNHRNTDNSS